MKGHANRDNEVDEDLSYDPVYHKVSQTPRKHVHDRLPTSNTDEDSNDIEGVPSMSMSYTQMKLSDVNKRARKYFDKIGLCYTDTSLLENGGGSYRIDDIVRCNNFKKGKISKTLFYKFYDTNLYDSRPTRDSEFRYIPLYFLLSLNYYMNHCFLIIEYYKIFVYHLTRFAFKMTRVI